MIKRMKTEPIEAAASAASGAMYAGSGALVVGGILASDIAILIGAVLGVAGFAVNWYYKHADHQLRKARVHASEDTVS
jgi:hypothetical protein